MALHDAQMVTTTVGMNNNTRMEKRRPPKIHSKMLKQDKKKGKLEYQKKDSDNPGKQESVTQSNTAIVIKNSFDALTEEKDIGTMTPCS